MFGKYVKQNIHTVAINFFLPNWLRFIIDSLITHPTTTKGNACIVFNVKYGYFDHNTYPPVVKVNTEQYLLMRQHL